MDKPVYAVVCGALRLEFEFFTTIACLCEKRKQGLINGIVVSTWVGEDSYIPGIKDKLGELDIEYVETPEPLNVSEGESIIYFRQAIQLKKALDILPDDVFVLKCRTDYSNFDINRFDLLNSKDLSPKKCDRLNPLVHFEYKIAVLRLGVSALFSFHDICYLGYKDDLKKLVSLEDTGREYGQMIIPDIWFFLAPFIHNYPIIEDWFSFVDYRKFQSLMNAMVDLGEDIELPNVLNRLYALYFLLFSENFGIFHDFRFSEDTAVTLHDIFYSNRALEIRKDWAVEIRSSTVIDRIINGKVVSSPGYDRLYDYIERAKKHDREVFAAISNDEISELISWSEKYFGDASYINYKEKIEPKKPVSDMGSDEALEVLFSGYKVSDEAKEAVTIISFNTQSYYNSIIDRLEVFKACDYSLYKKALFSSARYFNPKVLRAISEVLISEEDVDKREATYIFKRFSNDPRLYRYPMNDDLLTALKNYCLYEKKSEETNVVAQGFFASLIKHLGHNYTKEDFSYDLLNELILELTKG